MEKDEIFELAERYVNATGKSVFLTGKAGTGKTTFLKYLTQTTPKRFVVLAPTGVAAVNAGGSTIHSFFLLPLCPYLPDVKELITEYQMPDHYKSMRKERVKLIRTLDLIIIDEISMVRADLLDAVDMMLRKIRRNDRPFGGVQLLMVGDANQLSPVVKESERKYISQVYPSPYFFHSKALQKISYVTIEFQKVHRQQDREFLEILNAVRDNTLTSSLLAKLNSRVGHHGDDDISEPIRLTTHNRQADELNNRKIEELGGEAVEFDALIEGDFPENSYPADPHLSLKEGAQVMFIKNDPEGKFFNGKICTITEIRNDGTIVVTDGNGDEIEVDDMCWENIKYALDDETGEITQSVVGTFKQVPLRVAWAITIHKSQGLTFDRVIIDASAAFAFGQVYVALSRCRSLEGITLESPLNFSCLYSDNDVAQFNSLIPAPDILKGSLPSEEKAYRFGALKEIFSFEAMGKGCGWLLKLWYELLNKLYPAERQTLSTIRDHISYMDKTGKTFNVQLSQIEAAQPTNEDYLAERLSKAAAYFKPVLDEIQIKIQALASLEIDNKESARKIKEASDELLTELEIKCRAMNMILGNGFDSDKYNKIKTDCLLEDRKKASNKKTRKLVSLGSGDTVNSELRDALMQWRTDKFKAENVPAYTIMHQSTLLTIASVIPRTKEELMAIKGFGEAKFKKYGEEILEITAKYH